MKVLYLLALIASSHVVVCQTKKPFQLPMLVNHPVPGFQSGYKLAIEDINNSSTILPDRNIEVDFFFSLNVPEILKKMIGIVEDGHTLISGNEYSGFVAFTGILGDVYGVAQISSMAISTQFSNKLKYPHVSRITTPSDGEISAIMAMLEHFSRVQGPGWTDVAIFALGSEYGINQATNFINLSKDNQFDVLTYQTYIEFQEDFDIEMRELQISGARVILSFVFDTDWPQIVTAADSFGLIGESYVWIASDDLSGVEFSGTAGQLSRGLLAPSQYIPPTKEYQDFVDRWLVLDQDIYPGSGSLPGTFTLQGYDAIFLAARAIDELDRKGILDREERIPAELWSSTIRNITFNGVTGSVQLEPNGDRVADVSIGYFKDYDKTWTAAFSWTEAGGLNEIEDIIWFSNTTDIPDLDIRPPFHYWSCEAQELQFDETGKTVSLNTPDGSDVDEIDSVYHCDHFIDCKNFSDESVDCSENFLIIFIVFGIITTILILICVVLLIFVFLFGIILKYQRFRVSSPVFLVLILLSMIVGYLSVFAWFGKPHPVACAFQPWLLGLSSISMIAALCSKTFRIWRIFGDGFKRQKITDLKMLALWGCFVAPALFILILWTIISTPTADIKEVRGEDHYVCTTGGFTGEPGGYIFFAILVAYGGLVLSVGAFLSIATRKVPALFNESKLLGISIYNLGFLSVVIIPVFLVLQSFNPFEAWVVRTIAILYAFTATMTLQFVPIIIRVVILDNCRNVDNSSSLAGKKDSVSTQSNQ